MYCIREMAKGLARIVPKLREIHVIHDSWTKLNVTPVNNAGTIIRPLITINHMILLSILARECTDRVTLKYNCL